MTSSLGADLTSLETRLNVVEQQSSVAHAPSVSVTAGAGGTPVVRDSLTWSAGWSSYAVLVSGQPNPALPNYPSLSWKHQGINATDAAGAQAIRVGPMCFLTGLVLRTGTALSSGGVNSKMFMLPAGWRPRTRTYLICPAIPSAAATMALIEIKPDFGQLAGGVYLNMTNVNLGQNTGWLALQGAFPCFDIPGS